MFEEYEDILTVQEACDALSTGKNTIYQLIKDNKLKAFRIGKIYKIRNTDLQQFVRTISGLSS